MGSSEGRALLDVLLEHVRRVTNADAACLCEWDPDGDAYAVVAVSGDVAGIAAGASFPLGGVHRRREVMGADEATVIAADDPGLDPPTRDMLAAADVASALMVPVVDRPGGLWFLDVLYREPDRRVGADERAAAADLAPLAAAAVVRDELVRELAAAAEEEEAAHEQLLASERRFRDLLEGVRMAAAMVDRDFSIIFCNDFLTELTGWSREELLGREWTSVLTPPEERRAGADMRLKRELALGRIVPHDEAPVLTRGGEQRIIAWNSTALRDRDGAVIGLATIGEDVTERRRMEAELHESEQRRQHLLESLLHREEEERARIATELHDDTIQVITAALLSIDRLSRAALAGDSERLETALAAVRGSLQAAVDRTRRLTFELRPPLLERHGIVPALRDLLEESAKDGGFETSLNADVGRYPFAVEDLTYRTIQEAVVNARKHSAARRLEVVVADDGTDIVGHVRDDGRGFDVEQALDRSRMRLHLGLDAMVERVRLAGGDVEMDANPGRGATIRFRIPLSLGAGFPTPSVVAHAAQARPPSSAASL